MVALLGPSGPEWSGSPKKGGEVFDIRPVLFLNGILLLFLAVLSGIPAVLCLTARGGDVWAFLGTMAAAMFTGGALVLSGGPAQRRLDPRQMFLLAVSAWVLVALIAALPFLLSRPGLSPTDAVFEAMSGVTTTGATVMVGLDTLPRALLLWRAMLNWLGGAGVIALAVAVLPVLRIGGMQMFKVESERSEKARPRASRLLVLMIAAYGGVTVVAAMAFWLAGMNRFDALCQAMAAVSTGGFSTSDQSLGHWGVAVQWVAVAAMVTGGMPLPLLASRRASFFRDPQVRAYLLLLGGATLALGFWRWVDSDGSLEDSLRQAAFGVSSVTTTTGFVATDYTAWGGFAQVVFFVLAFVGGCAGSCAGGIKIFRWQVLFSVTGAHIRRLLHPHGVFAIDFDHRPVEDAVIDSVLALVVFYILTFAVFALLLTAAGLDLVTALSGSAAALGNGSHGLGGLIGPAGNFRALSDAAKWILSVEMLIGRLEVFTVFVLFSPAFWRE
jgi:trk system potassium uptake protein